jgi:hypothetical protein
VLYRPANDKIVELAPVNDAATNWKTFPKMERFFIYQFD